VTVCTLDPLRDPRWAQFVSGHHKASAFHTVPWLNAICRTYGYTPIVYTTTKPGMPLTNGVVLCQIKSWLTGRRMVSVPFSDHCEPLLDDESSTTEIFKELKHSVDSGEWDYVEMRPKQRLPKANGAIDSPQFLLHMLDLAPSEDTLFKTMHPDCVQRKVRKAERERLEYRAGNSPDLLSAFYRLMVFTRRKHRLPPQPIEWFRNLVQSMRESLTVRVAFKDGKEVASILTLRHRNVMVYKYGASDPALQNLGGTPLLFWRTICEAKAAGLQFLDLGRSEADNEGLIAFKNRLGARSSMLIYQRWSRKPTSIAASDRSVGLARRLFSVMPDSLFRATGRILYRHVG
jgi:CelD/BcsL family acetyltransferase involved in cellulose biosynthesis